MSLLLTAGSVVLAILMLLSTYLISRKQREGWLVSIICNVVAVPYDYFTRQYGFWAVSAVSLAIAISAWVRWTRP